MGTLCLSVSGTKENRNERLVEALYEYGTILDERIKNLAPDRHIPMARPYAFNGDVDVALQSVEERRQLLSQLEAQAQNEKVSKELRALREEVEKLRNALSG